MTPTRTALLAVVASLALTTSLPAQEIRLPRFTPEKAETPASPVDDFAKQVDALKQSLEGVNGAIEERAKALADLQDAKKLKEEIEGLRGHVAKALGSVADDSKVTELGQQALRHARAKQEQIGRDTRFTKEQRDFLLAEWNRLTVDTEKASGDLETARREFVQLLKVLQTREDFIDELLQIQRASEAVEIIRQLSTEIRNASDALRTVIRALKPPGV